MSIIFNPHTGRRAYRTASARIFARVAAIFARKGVWLWIMEISGVALLAVGVGMIFTPGAIIILGLYAVLIGNMES